MAFFLFHSTIIFHWYLHCCLPSSCGVILMPCLGIFFESHSWFFLERVIFSLSRVFGAQKHTRWPLSLTVDVQRKALFPQRTLFLWSFKNAKAPTGSSDVWRKWRNFQRRRLFRLPPLARPSARPPRPHIARLKGQRLCQVAAASLHEDGGRGGGGGESGGEARHQSSLLSTRRRSSAAWHIP